MCEIFEYVRGVVFVVVIFSINSCDNLYICIIYIFEFVVDHLYIYNFESVSCIQCIVIKPPSKLINFTLKKITIRVIESLGNFKFFLEDLFTFKKNHTCYAFIYTHNVSTHIQYRLLGSLTSDCNVE